MASYLSPPIAMVYCLAIAWPRVNEAVRRSISTASHCISLHLQGAFWSLMYGLLAGVIRMILDFSFPEPLCMEADQRPWLVRTAVYLVSSHI